MLFEPAHDANMSETSCAASAECDADSWAGLYCGLPGRAILCTSGKRRDRQEDQDGDAGQAADGSLNDAEPAASHARLDFKRRASLRTNRRPAFRSASITERSPRIGSPPKYGGTATFQPRPS